MSRARLLLAYMLVKAGFVLALPFLPRMIEIRLGQVLEDWKLLRPVKRGRE